MMYSLDRPSARVIGRVDCDYDYDDDETVELELNESAIRALNEAAALALAAFEGRAEPRLTHELGVVEGFEQETRVDERGPRALEREATEARQASEPVEQEAPAARQASGAFEQEEAPAARQASGAFEQEEAPAARQADEASVQVKSAVRQVTGALEQETPTGSQGAVSFPRPPRKSRRFAVGLGMAAAAAGLFGGLAYLATARAPHPIPIVADSGSRPTVAPKAPTLALPPAPPATLATPATPEAPVRFKNPFDSSEVFEFPAGTSWTEMRDAVAELLAQRARERQSLFVKRPPRNTKTADQNASVTAGRVTPHS
jgi:hypothetical protein